MDKTNQKRICGVPDKQYVKNWCPSLIQGLVNFFVASFVRYCPNKICKIEILHFKLNRQSNRFKCTNKTNLCCWMESSLLYIQYLWLQA